MNLGRLFDIAYRENMDVILRMVEPDENAKILDCGCGNGDFTTELANRIGTSHVYGVELIEELAEAAENRGIKVYQANLNEKLPIGDETFDVVHANQIIEHLFETDRFIREIYRVLKQGGYAIISTPNLASLHSIVSLLFGKQPLTAHISNEIKVGTLVNPRYSKHSGKGSAHLRIFTYDGLKKLFEYYGFRIEKIIGVGYYPFPTRIARLLSQLDKRHAAYLTMKVRR